MICRRRVISGVVGILLLAAGARADMVPGYRADFTQPLPSCAARPSEMPYTSLPGLNDSPVVPGSGLGACQFPRGQAADIEQSAQKPHASIDMTGGPSSVGLCLYALVGLGLCGCPHWIRRLSFSHIPEWYHEGGPCQIGHSFAVSSESLCPVPVCCFVQPDWIAEEFEPQYRLRAIVSLWRKSQFVPDVVASRGPPEMS